MDRELRGGVRPGGLPVPARSPGRAALVMMGIDRGPADEAGAQGRLEEDVGGAGPGRPGGELRRGHPVEDAVGAVDADLAVEVDDAPEDFKVRGGAEFMEEAGYEIAGEVGGEHSHTEHVLGSPLVSS